jgi:hypothetical protein
VLPLAQLLPAHAAADVCDGASAAPQHYAAALPLPPFSPRFCADATPLHFSRYLKLAFELRHEALCCLLIARILICA